MRIKKILLLSLLVSQCAAISFDDFLPFGSRRVKIVKKDEPAKRTETQKPAQKQNEQQEITCDKCPKPCHEVLKELEEQEEKNEQEYTRRKSIFHDEAQKSELSDEDLQALETGSKERLDFATFEKVVRWRVEIKSKQNGEIAIQGTPKSVLAALVVGSAAVTLGAEYALRHYGFIS